MHINLSWDLFVIVFFTVIIAYSFIIGRNQTTKIIISSYIAILTSDGIGNIIERYFVGSGPVLNTFKLGTDPSSLIILKIMIFVLTIVILAVRGRFSISLSGVRSFSMNVSLSLCYGILSAGLIVSTILIYASGASLVQESTQFMNDAMREIYQQSQLVQLMINNYNLWFSLPAITFMLSSFIGSPDEA